MAEDTRSQTFDSTTDGIEASDPFEGLSEAEKLKRLIATEQYVFSDTWLYCLRGLIILLDIIVIPRAITFLLASVGKEIGVIGGLYYFAIIFCCVFSIEIFAFDNCKRRAEKELQAQVNRQIDEQLQSCLSEADALTITEKVNFKWVAIRLLLNEAAIYIVTFICLSAVVIFCSGFDNLMRDLTTPAWSNFLIFPVLALTLLLSLVPIVLILCCWSGSSLTFDKRGISGEVYNGFNGSQNVIGYYSDKRKDGTVISYYYDVDTNSEPNYIKWHNFKCFSVHGNCLVLWQKEEMRANFLTKLYIKLGWNVCLNQYPLRIIGTPTELTELKYMLTKLMPCCYNLWPGEKAVL